VQRSRLTTLLVAAAVGALFVAGLAVHGVIGGLLLALVAVVLVALSTATWQHLPQSGRVARGLVILLVGGLAAAKLAGGL